MKTGDRNIHITSNIKDIEKSYQNNSLYYYFTLEDERYMFQGRDWYGFIDELNLKDGDTILIKGGHIKEYEPIDNYPSLQINEEDYIKIIKRSKPKEGKEKITRTEGNLKDQKRKKKLVEQLMNRP